MTASITLRAGSPASGKILWTDPIKNGVGAMSRPAPDASTVAVVVPETESWITAGADPADPAEPSDARVRIEGGRATNVFLQIGERLRIAPIA